MSLRAQLLTVSLLLLSLPWAGCQYLREMESTLRQGQGMAVTATAKAIASALQERGSLVYPVAARRLQQVPIQDWYIASADPGLVVDGYSNDWQKQAQLSDLPNTPRGVRLKAATLDSQLYVLLEVSDSTLRYRSPSAMGDRLLLHCIDALGANSRFTLSAEAPGLIRAQGARSVSSLTQSIRGAWRERADGYTIEFRLPLDARCQRTSLSIIDVGNSSENQAALDVSDAGLPETVRYTLHDSFQGRAPWLVYRVSALDDWLEAFAESGRQLRVRDAEDWLVGEHSGIASRDASRVKEEESGGTEVFWMLRAFYRMVLGNGALPETTGSPVDGTSTEAWQIVTDDAGDSVLVRARATVRDNDGVLGSVELIENTERYLALTDRATSRVFGVSALVLITAFACLLLYATFLSWRIRQLRDAARDVAANERGADTFPRSRARDELGELSRSYADLLNQIGEYNHYLRGLARTLSHELRTPIAVVSSSLENLRNGEQNAEKTQAYTARAQEGLSRLTRIVTAMSDASRIEESIQDVHHVPLDLADLLAKLVEAYSNSFPGQEFKARIDTGPCTVSGNGELIAQALDKLIENAVSFAQADTPISVTLRNAVDGVTVEVANQGPTLPRELSERLFEPMVSIRNTKGDDAHLGLGLHIARTIAEAHEGTLKAENLGDLSGVVFSLHLPAPERDPVKKHPLPGDTRAHLLQNHPGASQIGDSD